MLLKINPCLVPGISLNPELSRKVITLQPGRTDSQLGCLGQQDPWEALPPWHGLSTGHSCPVGFSPAASQE